MKLHLHHKFCTNPPEGSVIYEVPRRAMTCEEHQIYRTEVNTYPTGININIPERNQEATVYLQEFTSTLLIQMLSRVHLRGNTSHDYRSYDFFQSVSFL